MLNPSETDAIVIQKESRRAQVWRERELALLDIAENIMLVEGFSGLTMDKLVAACPYSKGTVYNHFNSKEDLLCALCIKGMRISLELFKKAQGFSGNSREKILAIHFAYRLHALAYPTLFLCVLTSQTPAVKEKAAPQRLQLQEQLDKELTGYIDKLFSLALDKGDIRADLEVRQLTFSSWALSFGSNALLTMAGGVQGVQRLDQDQALLTSINLLMDGMGWQPMSRDWDYSASWQRIGMDVFATELNELSKRTKL